MATQMTPGGARVIDPILTSIARGFKQAEFVGSALFPTVPVGQRGGKVLSFSTEDFKLYSTQRAPGSNTKRVQYGHSSISYSLEDHGLEGVVPEELMQEASAVPGIDLARVAIMKTQRIIGMRLEKAQADLAQTSGNYTVSNTAALSGTDQWSHASSDPAGKIEAAKEFVRSKIGLRPNVMVMGPAVFTALMNNPQVRDRLKYTTTQSLTTDMLAAWFGFRRVLVGDGVYNASDASSDFTDIWGKNVIIAYTDMSGLADMGVPTFGYTYQLSGYPIVETPYQERNAKSWIYPVTDVVAPVIAGNAAAYLYTTVVA